MAIKIVPKGEWDLVDVPEDVRHASPLLDKSELAGVQVAPINARDPYVVIMREPANHYSSVHYHTASEAMIVLDGKMMLNGVWCGAGSVVYIDEGEEYWHSTGEEGCVVALVRPGGKAQLVPGADSRTMIARHTEASAG